MLESEYMREIIGLKQEIQLKVDKTTTIAGQELSSKKILLSKNDIGLSSVDNTSDMNKPISMSTKLGLDSKVDKTQTVNGYSLGSLNGVKLTKVDIGLSNVDDTSDMCKPVSVAQQALLNLKVDKSTTIQGYALSSAVRLSKRDLGLENVDNTSDCNKPLSMRMQMSLNDRQRKISMSAHDESSMLSITGLNDYDIVKRIDQNNALYQYLGGDSCSLSNWQRLGDSYGVRVLDFCNDESLKGCKKYALDSDSGMYVLLNDSVVRPPGECVDESVTDYIEIILPCKPKIGTRIELIVVSARFHVLTSLPDVLYGNSAKCTSLYSVDLVGKILLIYLPENRWLTIV